MPESSERTVLVTDPAGVGAVILAAGASTRMGALKQLLQFRGQTFLRRGASVALKAGCRAGGSGDWRECDAVKESFARTRRAGSDDFFLDVIAHREARS